MRINMLIPDDLLEKVSREAEFKSMNRTQYFIRAVQAQVQADSFLRANPNIEQTLIEVNQKISSMQEQINQIPLY